MTTFTTVTSIDLCSVVLLKQRHLALFATAHNAHTYVLNLLSDLGSEINRVNVGRLCVSAVPNDGLTQMSELITKYRYPSELCFVVGLHTAEYNKIRNEVDGVLIQATPFSLPETDLSCTKLVHSQRATRRFEASETLHCVYS